MLEAQAPLLVHAAATWFMVGLIWFVQVVHYPLFAGVGRAEWAAYHRRHSALTTRVVALPMTVELLTSVWLLLDGAGRYPAWALWASCGLAVSTWLLTGLAAVPLHDRLGRGGETAETIRRLVLVNWLRTAAWTARSALLLWLAAPALLHAA
jgi:hypothetical protein